jgi:hypothetical protein
MPEVQIDEFLKSEYYLLKEVDNDLHQVGCAGG